MTVPDALDPFDLLAGLVALAGGYLAGSLPVAARLEQASGRLHPADRSEPQGRVPPREPRRLPLTSAAVAVWRTAGPGPGLLALAGELAKGLLPVAIAAVTWSWWAGWAAALGAVVGSRRPAWGPRRPHGDAAVLAGACVVLSPLAGIVAAIAALVAGGVTRALGGSAGFAMLLAGPGAFLALTLVGPAGPGRAAAIAALVVVATLPLPAARR